MQRLFVRGNRTALIMLLVCLRRKSEVTALPFKAHTLDSWALQMCVRIKAKLFMMDDITDSDTVMGWKYGQNTQMV